jgi:hypothetical protein
MRPTKDIPRRQTRRARGRSLPGEAIEDVLGIAEITLPPWPGRTAAPPPRLRRDLLHQRPRSLSAPTNESGRRPCSRSATSISVSWGAAPLRAESGTHAPAFGRVRTPECRPGARLRGPAWNGRLRSQSESGECPGCAPSHGRLSPKPLRSPPTAIDCVVLRSGDPAAPASTRCLEPDRRVDVPLATRRLRGERRS